MADVRALLSAALPLTPTDLAFLERLDQHGDIVPELLTDDEAERDLVRALRARNGRRRTSASTVAGCEQVGLGEARSGAALPRRRARSRLFDRTILDYIRRFAV